MIMYITVVGVRLENLFRQGSRGLSLRSGRAFRRAIRKPKTPPRSLRGGGAALANQPIPLPRHQGPEDEV